MFKTNMRRKGVNVYSICSKVLDDENYDTKLSGNKITNGLVRELALKAKQANVKDFIRKTYEWFIKVIPSELRSKFVDVMLHSPPSTSSSPSPLLLSSTSSLHPPCLTTPPPLISSLSQLQSTVCVVDTPRKARLKRRNEVQMPTKLWQKEKVGYVRTITTIAVLKNGKQ